MKTKSLSILWRQWYHHTLLWLKQQQYEYMISSVLKKGLSIDGPLQYWYGAVLVWCSLNKASWWAKYTKGVQIDSKNPVNSYFIQNLRRILLNHSKVNANRIQGKESGWIGSKYEQQESELTQIIILVQMYTSAKYHRFFLHMYHLERGESWSDLIRILGPYLCHWHISEKLSRGLYQGDTPPKTGIHIVP